MGILAGIKWASGIAHESSRNPSPHGAIGMGDEPPHAIALKFLGIAPFPMHDGLIGLVAPETARATILSLDVTGGK